MLIFWVIVPVVVLVVASLIAVAIYTEKQKMSRIKAGLQTVVDRFNGHVIDQGRELPKLVLDHEGRRFHVSLKAGAVYPLYRVDFTSDSTSPNFKLTVVPNSISTRAQSWFDKSCCKTEDPTFDSKFVIATNENHESIDRILSHSVRNEILVGCRYVEIKEKPEHEVQLNALHPFIAMQPYGNPIKTLENTRISMLIKGGQIETSMFIEPIEIVRLADILLSVMSTHAEIDRNQVLLSKEEGQLKTV